MAFKGEHCKAWVEAQAVVGEQFVSFLVTGTRTPTNPAPVGRLRTGIRFSGTEAVRDLARRLELDDADKVGLMVESTFLALTALNRDQSHRTNLHQFFEALGDRARLIGT